MGGFTAMMTPHLIQKPDGAAANRGLNAMQRAGVCGAERTESELARDIWVQVREEAIGAVEHDRAMSEIIRDTPC